MKELPEVVLRINKEKKTIKITTLNEAKAFLLKRLFTGSIGVDCISGGGFAYRRIQLLFGSKSSGKNALLNQTIAYSQRLCRKCHSIHPEYILEKNTPKDYWTFNLMNILGFGLCKCDKPEAKRAFILDYEKSLAIEQPRDVIVQSLINKATGEEIDGLDYTDSLSFVEEMRVKDTLTDKEKEELKATEKFLKGIDVKESTINQIAMTDYLVKCGVNVNELLVADPEDTEEGIELVKDMVKSKEVDIIIWDSLQAAIPRYVKDREADQATMGVEAKQNGLLMRQVCSAFAAHDLTDESEAYKPGLFITSQVRAKIGGFTSLPDTYSGGNAIQHHISLALELKREKFIKADGTDAEFKDTFYGQRIRLRADKNKLSSPGDMYECNYFFREGAEFPIGIDLVGELISVAIKKEIIERAGSYYKVLEQSVQGMQAVKDIFRNAPKLVRELYVKTMNKF